MKTVFVTVGSTSFDDLTHAVLDAHFLDELSNQGYTHLVLQHGQVGRPIKQSTHSKVNLRLFTYAPTLSEEVLAADLIISHAGAGSILEALHAKKRLIVVANETLMDNHQLELAQKLSKDGYCMSATPDTLLQGLRLCNVYTGRQLSTSDGSALTNVFKGELVKLTGGSQ